ncbi:hypothetical protein DEU56DRAFT_871714 [Suillus clintonianus]|uniref:uncharacterized protein n=1 Tax=Suillus clintonianus TaxID=1904413 RepID=UPI001B86B513|nr:uncharacterized protein DEU56DRAFT_871714 [Suillus clintonianus]KAG2135283.1 hypothetical protein DEU56DRAFT_871714 [Suillus clintonianus]
MKSFFSALLGFDAANGQASEGILGTVKAYFGCVEAQGRGTLHCHLMVWLEGGLDPNEIKARIHDMNDIKFRDRLLALLDDSICNEIPPDPGPEYVVPSSIHHPCAVRGIAVNSDHKTSDNSLSRQKDLHNVVKACQIHKHNATCFKYWKGPPAPRECRFDLSEDHFCPASYFNTESGEICLKCLDGMVNNFNKTMMEAVRCNMDIKFIGSGASAKAILYYITDYITKSQLKAHVAYAALDLAQRKLSEYDPADDELVQRAKELIRKSAHAMISHQELSAQQVSAYLMDQGDHYTSHEFQNLFWTSFERHFEDTLPKFTLPMVKNRTLGSLLMMCRMRMQFQIWATTL